jgi:hypothetical protein
MFLASLSSSDVVPGDDPPDSSLSPGSSYPFIGIFVGVRWGAYRGFL